MSTFELFLKSKAHNKEPLDQKIIGLDGLATIRKHFDDKDAVKKEATQSYLNNIDVYSFEEVPSEINLQNYLYSKILEISNNPIEKEDFFNFVYQNLLSCSPWRSDNNRIKRGALSEFIVVLVLDTLKKNGVICDYMIARNFSILDMNGVDVQITFTRKAIRDSMPLQIKSSIMGQQEHIMRYGKTIPSVVVEDNTNINIKKLKEKIEYILHAYRDYDLTEHV